MARHEAFKCFMFVQASPSYALGDHFHIASLLAQGQPIINRAAADVERLVCLHFAQAAINSCQNSQA